MLNSNFVCLDKMGLFISLSCKDCSKRGGKKSREQKHVRGNPQWQHWEDPLSHFRQVDGRARGVQRDPWLCFRWPLVVTIEAEELMFLWAEVRWRDSSPATHSHSHVHSYSCLRLMLVLLYSGFWLTIEFNVKRYNYYSESHYPKKNSTKS